MASLNLISPWAEHYKKIQAFFANDNDVKVVYDNENRRVKLYVKKCIKACALSKLLPEAKTFGSVSLSITVVPPNGYMPQEIEDAYRAAFEENMAVAYIEDVDWMGDAPVKYIVFRREVVQYFTDDLSDIHGISSTLYENIARDIFRPQTGVYYCTNIKENMPF